MTDWPPPGAEPGPSQYSGPPPTGPYEPQQPIPQAPGQQPYPYGYGYAYPPAGYPGYGFAPGEQRPGTVIAAAVLGYIAAGLLIFAGILLFTGASTLNDLDDTYGISDTYSGELTVAGIVNLIAAGLLIGGAVAMTGRSHTGRTVYVVGGAIVIVLAVYWLARWATKSGLEDVIFYALLFAALVIIGMSLAWAGGAGRWFASRTR
ncbi:MAG TPA: proline-rich domain-containing protein [Jatrophihabitans sp.]|nr:proline-rich domain-containing protein [Jatrophihabitans sp.]